MEETAVTGVLNKQQAAVVRRIQNICETLEQEFGLDGWCQITHRYDTGMDGDTSDDDGVNQTTACTTTQWQYRQAQIRWYLPMAATTSDESLELIAIHEYVHVLLDPIYSVLPTKPGIDKLNEYVTECLCRVIGRCRGMEGIR
jgi:hypothetical protein